MKSDKLNTIEKLSFAINQIAINNCDGSANEKGIKAVRYLQEVNSELTTEDNTSEANLTIPDVSNSLSEFLEHLRSENIDINDYTDEEIIKSYLTL